MVETFLEGLAEGLEGKRSAGPFGMHNRDLKCVHVQIWRLAVHQNRVHAVESLHIVPVRASPPQERTSLLYNCIAHSAGLREDAQWVKRSTSPQLRSATRQA